MHLRQLIACLLLACIARYAVADEHPVITKVSGTIGSDEKITITGTGFGSGPKVVLFDDFRSGETGKTHVADAVIGKWSETHGIIFPDPKLSKKQGMRVVDTPGALVSKFVFPEPASELFVSFVGYVPDGYKFPSATEEKKLPTVSALKVAWLLDGRDAYHKPGSDYVLAGYGGGLYRIASNDAGGPSTFDVNREIGWRWGEPVRWAYWIKSNGTQKVGSDGLFQATNGENQVRTSYKDYKPWFRDATPDGRWESHPNHHWDRINFVGYVRSAASFDEKHNFVLSDIYIATGANSAARVEIGNAATYDACTRLALATPVDNKDSWTDTSITVHLREGGFTPEELKRCYLYVINGVNEVNESGYRLVKKDVGNTP